MAFRYYGRHSCSERVTVTRRTVTKICPKRTGDSIEGSRGDEDDPDSYRIGGYVSRVGNRVLVSNLDELLPKLYIMFKMRLSVGGTTTRTRTI